MGLPPRQGNSCSDQDDDGDDDGDGDGGDDDDQAQIFPQQRVALPWLSLDVHHGVAGNRPPHSYFTFADNHYFVIVFVMIYT